jgi:hypothetical protein
MWILIECVKSIHEFRQRIKICTYQYTFSLVQNPLVFFTIRGKIWPATWKSLQILAVCNVSFPTTAGPVKEEEVYLKPRIVVYHDFLSDPEVETVKRLATPRFKRATVQNYKTGELETASYRYFFATPCRTHIPYFGSP